MYGVGPAKLISNVQSVTRRVHAEYGVVFEPVAARPCKVGQEFYLLFRGVDSVDTRLTQSPLKVAGEHLSVIKLTQSLGVRLETLGGTPTPLSSSDICDAVMDQEGVQLSPGVDDGVFFAATLEVASLLTQSDWRLSVSGGSATLGFSVIWEPLLPTAPSDANTAVPALLAHAKAAIPPSAAVAASAPFASPLELSGVYILHDAGSCALPSSVSAESLPQSVAREAYAALCGLPSTLAAALDIGRLRVPAWTLVMHPTQREPGSTLLAELRKKHGFMHVDPGPGAGAIATEIRRCLDEILARHQHHRDAMGLPHRIGVVVISDDSDAFAADLGRLMGCGFHTALLQHKGAATSSSVAALGPGRVRDTWDDVLASAAPVPLPHSRAPITRDAMTLSTAGSAWTGSSPLHSASGALSVGSTASLSLLPEERGSGTSRVVRAERRDELSHAGDGRDSFERRVAITGLDARVTLADLRRVLEQCGTLALLAMGPPKTDFKTGYAEFTSAAGSDNALKRRGLRIRGRAVGIARLPYRMRHHPWPPRTVVECEYNESDDEEDDDGSDDGDAGDENFDQRLVLHKVSPAADPNELLRVLESAGQVTMLALGPVRASFRSAFALYATSTGPARAIETLSGTPFMGRPLTLQRPNNGSRHRDNFPNPVRGPYKFADVANDKLAPAVSKCRVELSRLHAGVTRSDLVSVLEQAGPIAELVLDNPRPSQSGRHIFRRAYVTFTSPEAAEAVEELPAELFEPLSVSAANQCVMVIGPRSARYRRTWPSAPRFSAESLPPPSVKLPAGSVRESRRALLGVPAAATVSEISAALSSLGLPELRDAAISKQLGKHENRVAYLSFDSAQDASAADPLLRSMRICGVRVDVLLPKESWNGPWPPAKAIPILGAGSFRSRQAESREPRHRGSDLVATLQPPRYSDTDGASLGITGKRKRATEVSGFQGDSGSDDVTDFRGSSEPLPDATAMAPLLSTADAAHRAGH
jgi:hypothetical protein